MPYVNILDLKWNIFLCRQDNNLVIFRFVSAFSCFYLPKPVSY